MKRLMVLVGILALVFTGCATKSNDFLGLTLRSFVFGNYPLVLEVRENSFADQLGLRKGDRLVKVANVWLEGEGPESVDSTLRTLYNNGEVVVGVDRGGKWNYKVLTAVRGIGVKFGQNLVPLGVVVVSVIPGTPAQKAGLKMDDFIVAVNGLETPWASAARDCIIKSETDSVELEVKRNKKKSRMNIQKRWIFSQNE